MLRSGKFANQNKGFTEFEKWVASTCAAPGIRVSIIMEATGVYYENCALFLFTKGFRVSVVLPNKSKKYIAALGIKTKTDKVDAKALSRMGAEQALGRWQPMGGFFYKLRSLTRPNQLLKEMRTALAKTQRAKKDFCCPAGRQVSFTQTATPPKIYSTIIPLFCFRRAPIVYLNFKAACWVFVP